ncbi:MAG TPA: dTDP-4-dehydrorhamnose 3,5-epimerase [Rhizomicrobium sp.]|jgi:dTDP-4-dehydrorhamnose 3,5-epimerase|nr:dTDP-4-dehydrorhamnose 3,5-epimerase [Rhizomicrobium sp.]
MNLPTVENTPLEGVLLIAPRRFSDNRGHFCETYNRAAFERIGVVCNFIQDNQSFSRQQNTVRGLHFQIPPFAQAKLIRVLRGAIFDVAVDIRRGSPTCGRSFGATLSAENGRQLMVPAGYAHGFCTLEPDTEVLYKVNAPFSREHEGGLKWNDPALAIAWPIPEEQAVILDRDRDLPTLAVLPEYFRL